MKVVVCFLCGVAFALLKAETLVFDNFAVVNF
jgi:hypothetical protein